jgi:hypothetical protein
MYVRVGTVRLRSDGQAANSRGRRIVASSLMIPGLVLFRGLGAAQATSPSQLAIAQMIAASAPAIAAQYGVDPNVLAELGLGVASHESGFNASAVNPSGGAAGVMQLLPSTSATLGVSNPLDPQQNINGGLSFLAQNLARYNGDETLALWAYSNGPGSVTAGGSNLANMPAQAAGLVSYVESYQPPASIDLPGATSTSSDPALQASSDFDFTDLSDSFSTLAANTGSFFDSLDPTTAMIGGLALLLGAYLAAR